MIEESCIPTKPEAFERRFSSIAPMRIAHRDRHPLALGSRLLEECGHEVLVANARKVRLIYSEGRKNDKIDAEKLARLATARSRSYSRRSSIVGRAPRHTWRSSARAMRW